MGLFSSVPAFLALRGMGGAASAFVLVFASALVLERLAGSDRAGLSALHFAGVGVGIAFSAALVAALLAAGADWRTLWLASGAASLAAAAAVTWLVPPEEPPRAAVTPSPGAPGRNLAGIAPRPVEPAAASETNCWAIAYGLFGFGYVVTATFLVAIVRAGPELRTVEPFVWLVVGGAAAPTVAVWDRLGARWRVECAFAAACLVEAAGVAASVLWPTAAGALLAARSWGGP